MRENRSAGNRAVGIIICENRTAPNRTVGYVTAPNPTVRYTISENRTESHRWVFLVLTAPHRTAPHLCIFLVLKTALHRTEIFTFRNISPNRTVGFPSPENRTVYGVRTDNRKEP